MDDADISLALNVPLLNDFKAQCSNVELTIIYLKKLDKFSSVITTDKGKEIDLFGKDVTPEIV